MANYQKLLVFMTIAVIARISTSRTVFQPYLNCHCSLLVSFKKYYKLYAKIIFSNLCQISTPFDQPSNILMAGRITPLGFIFTSEATKFRVTDEVYLDIERDGQSLGRVVIGLFGDLAPRTVKNFKVLATKGIKGKSYKGTRFIRIIKRFMIQGGDVVSNDGKGSISIYGEHFEDENLETKHTVAGFVSMANKGADTNGCQFIITTIATPWLDHLHTVFGKVVEGQNIVHVIEHTATDVEDRPTHDVLIVKCGIAPMLEPYYISDDPYDLWAWIKASAVPLTMSFSILGFFHWMIKKMEI